MDELASLDDSAAIDAVAALLRDARHITILTGAGMSTESGIPDFRGPQGLWTRNPDAEKASNITYYMGSRDVRVQAWRSRVESNFFSAEPNDGHRALVALEQARPDAFDTLVTQNVDGLHHAAGNDPARIVEIHGNVREVKCMQCGWRGPMGDTLDRVRAGEDDPPCRACGGVLKSATVSFGESLDPTDLDRAQRGAMRADVFLAIGTSLGVYPAAALPEFTVRRGGDLVIINEQPTPFDQVAHTVLRGRIGAVLPTIVARI